MKKAISHQRSAISRTPQASRLQQVAQASLLVLLLIATGMSLLQGTIASAQSTNGLSLVASALNAPAGLALDVHQNLFVSDVEDGNIFRLRPNGRLLLEAGAFEEPRDFVFDKKGNLYVTDTRAGMVYRLDKKGNSITVGTGLLNVCCVALDVDESVLVLHQSAENASYAITRLTLVGQQTQLAEGFVNARGMVVDRNGNLTVAASGFFGGSSADVLAEFGAGLFRVDSSGVVTRILDLGSITPSGLTLSSQGTLLFAGTAGKDGAVFIEGRDIFRPLATGFVAPHGLAADRRYVYVADETAGKVWRIPLRPKAPAEISDAPAPADVAEEEEVIKARPDAEAKKLKIGSSGTNQWGYVGKPDYSNILVTPDGVPQAPAGATCVIGRVLRTHDDAPLGNVTVRLGLKAIRTNPQGYFILVNVPAGKQALLYDGRSADTKHVHYPIALVAYELIASDPNVLPFTNYFPVLDTAHAVKINPHHKTVLKTPLIPGVEIHVPKGTEITSIDGTPVDEISVTLVPPDKPLYPMNLVPDYGNHITIQPGGSTCSKPLKVIYNNPSKFPPGTRVQLWKNAALAHGGWFNYGMGTVSKKGKQIIPDDDAGIQTIGCGVGPRDPPPPADPPPPPHKNDSLCDPVRVGTGVFWNQMQDLVIPGLMPIAFSRTYRNQNSNAYAFGIGTRHSYDFHLYGAPNAQPGAYLDFVIPSDSSYRFSYQGASPLHTYVCTNDYRLAGAKIYQTKSAAYPTGDGWNYVAVMKDGTKYDFDGHGFLYAIRDANNSTLAVNRDGSTGGKLLNIVQPSGRRIDFSYNNQGLISKATDSAGRSVGYVYDAAKRLIAVTNVVGGVSKMAYDANHNLLTNVLPNNVTNVINFYDSANRVTNQFLADGGSYSIAYTTNATSGAITRAIVTEPSGAKFTNDYNAAAFITNHVDAAGNTSQYVLDSSTGVLNKIIDPLGRTNSYVYDANLNVVAITNAQGKVTQFSYTSDFNRLSSVIDPLGHANSFGYDGRGNLTSITNALDKVTTIAYNSFGLPTSVIDPLGHTYTFTYNESLDLASVKDPLGNEVKRALDALGRPIALTDAFGRTTRIDYGDVASGCGSCGGSEVDLPVSITDPLGGITKFGYDIVGNLTNVTDALNHSVSYGYDSMNRLTNRTDQLGKIEIYRYDKGGNVTNFVDRRGVSINFQYDLLDRRTGVVYGTESSAKFFYDVVGRVTNVNDSLAGAIGLTYDSLDRLTQELGPNGTNNYGYNDVGLRTNMTVTGETPVSYFYDAANRLTNVTQGTLTSSLFYDDLGRRTKLVLPNGINVLYSYDTASRLTNITYQGAVTNKIDYAHDDTGNRVAQASLLANYLLPAAVSTGTYNVANQQLTFGSYTMLYDANGNVTNLFDGAAHQALNWNSRNQLTGVVAAVSAAFQYDGLGRRKQRTVNGTTENYLYDGLDIIQQFTGSGAVGARYFRGLAIDEPWQRSDVGAATTNRTYLADALGSIVALTDSDKAIQTEYDYEPFGATTTTGAADNNSYKFTGREDDGTGLYYYRARYYHPALGRFVSEDPLDFLGGVNLYAYVGNEPVNSLDPLGLWAITIGGYYGWGGTITYGRNPNGGRFTTLRGGWGLGISLQYSPTQVSPGYNSLPNGAELTASGNVQGNASFFRVCKVSEGYGAGAHLSPGDEYTAFLPRVTPFRGPTGQPAVSLPPSADWGLNLSLSAGIQVTGY